MNSIDFLPESFHEERRRQGIAHRRWMLILITMLALVGWGVARHKQSSDLAWRTTSLESQAEVTQQKHNEMDKLRTERKQLVYQQNIHRQLDQSVRVTQAVSTIGRLMPDSCGLTSVLVNTHRPAPKPLEDPDDKKKKSSKKKQEKGEGPEPDLLQIEIQGIAPDDITVANLVNRMSDHPLFEKVTMHFSRVSEKDGLISRRFRIGAEVPLDRRYVPVTQTAEVDRED